MPNGHTRTRRALSPGHLGDLPVRRGHLFFFKRSEDPTACLATADRAGTGASRTPRAGLGRGKGHEAVRPRRGRLEQEKKL